MHRGPGGPINECEWKRAEGADPSDRAGWPSSRPDFGLTTTGLLMEAPTFNFLVIASVAPHDLATELGLLRANEVS